MASDKDTFGAKVIAMMRARFGDAVKGYWWYDGDTCPCCGAEIDAIVWKGERAISINGFMYRTRGILIAYFLCGTCAGRVMANTTGKETAWHTAIEDTLKAAYERHVASLDA